MVINIVIKPEVLCPAGDFMAVKAAVQNGANAIYIGGKQFSARKNAHNFEDDELAEAVTYCHIRGVKVYLAVNTIVFDSRLDAVREVIRLACRIGIDALIVQDLGVLRLARAMAPAMAIHASTQMAVHTKMGAQLLLRYGVKRVVVARELSLKEIAEIASLPLEVEVFVHGALCMSVSGQCYISGMIGGRSGNRGNCAGTCRLPFAITDVGEKGDYALSLKDNCLADHVQELAAAGVHSLKIEGRMKRPEYVAAAARVYRDAVDGNPFDIDTLRAVFSRGGFTDGYLSGLVDGDMFGFRGKDDVTSATNKLLRELENTYRKDTPLVPVTMALRAEYDVGVDFSMWDEDENKADCVLPAESVQKATSSPTTRELVVRSLSKLGGTPFYLSNIGTMIDDGIMISASAMNELRRTACEQLLSLRGAVKSIPVVEHIEPPVPAHDSADERGLRLRFTRFEQLCHVDDVDYIMLPLMEVERHISELTSMADKLIVELPRVMFGREESIATRLGRIKSAGFTHLLCDNLAHIEMGLTQEFTLHAGMYLNCVNSLSAAVLTELGVKDITMSFEGEITSLNRVQAAVPLGIVVDGYLPLMIMRNCPIKAKQDCVRCGGAGSLTDRMGVQFKVECSKQEGYVEVLNGDRLHMADRMRECKQDFAVIYFTVETKAECVQAVADYRAGKGAADLFTRGLYYRSI